jgi:hypothetical protein
MGLAWRSGIGNGQGRFGLDRCSDHHSRVTIFMRLRIFIHSSFEKKCFKKHFKRLSSFDVSYRRGAHGLRAMEVKISLNSPHFIHSRCVRRRSLETQASCTLCQNTRLIAPYHGSIDLICSFGSNIACPSIIRITPSLAIATVPSAIPRTPDA